MPRPSRPRGAVTTPATPKIVAAKPTLKTAKIAHRKHVVHHVAHVQHAKVVKHAKHVKIVRHAKPHKVAKVTKKSTITYMRAAPSTQPIVKKPVKHTVKTTHHVKQVRLAKKSTTHARTDAPTAPKSVN